MPGVGVQGKLAKGRRGLQSGDMKKLSPPAVLVIFGFVGLLFGKFGLFFPLGMAAAVIVAIVQNKQPE